MQALDDDPLGNSELEKKHILLMFDKVKGEELPFFVGDVWSCVQKNDC